MQTTNQAWHYLSDPVVALANRFAAVAPNLLGALFLLILGYFFGRFAGWVVRRLLRRLGFDNLAQRSGLDEILERIGARRRLSDLLGALAFAFIFLAFALSAVDALGLTSASAAVTEILLFFPRLAAAFLLLVLGLVVARWLAAGVQRIAENAGVEYAVTLQRITYGVLAAVVVLITIDQIGLHISLLHEVITVVLFGLGIAVALSLGLGTRSLSGELVSGVYLRDLLRAGDPVEWNGHSAEVLEVGTIKTSLRLADGRILTLPNSRLVADVLLIGRAPLNASVTPNEL
jgi:small-conductance mechanosensitive channel